MTQSLYAHMNKGNKKEGELCLTACLTNLILKTSLDNVLCSVSRLGKLDTRAVSSSRISAALSSSF
jgi:hypothetical protein